MGGDAVGPFERDAAALEEGEVRLVTDQREDGVGRERLLPGGAFDEDRAARDLQDARSEERPDLSRPDPILQVGLDPVLDALGDRGAPGDERDARAVPVEVEGRLGRGVLRAHDDDVASVEGVAGNVAPVDVGPVLAGDAEPLRIVEEPRRDDGRRSGERRRVLLAPEDNAPFLSGPDADDRGVRDDLDPELLGDGAVIGERLQAGGVGLGSGEGDAGDVQEIAGREPAHLLGKMVERVEQKPLVVADRLDAPFPELDRAGDARRSCADDGNRGPVLGHRPHFIGVARGFLPPEHILPVLILWGRNRLRGFMDQNTVFLVVIAIGVLAVAR